LQKVFSMAIVYFNQRSPLPGVIYFLRSLVCVFTITFAGWYECAFSKGFPYSPDILLLSPTAGWSWGWQPLTALVTIPYGGFGLSLIFDLLLINFFLTPIYTFVFSFLGKRWFIALLATLSILGSAAFVGLASLIGPAVTPNCSLFSGMSLAVVVFWLLLHRKGQNTLFLAFPISRRLAFAITAIATLYAPVAAREWAHIGAIVAMTLIAYVWGVAKWRLRSHIPALEGLEDWLESAYRAIFSD
jgi:hypothetical protein